MINPPGVRSSSGTSSSSAATSRPRRRWYWTRTLTCDQDQRRLPVRRRTATPSWSARRRGRRALAYADTAASTTVRTPTNTWSAGVAAVNHHAAEPAVSTQPHKTSPTGVDHWWEAGGCTVLSVLLASHGAMTCANPSYPQVLSLVGMTYILVVR